MALPFSRNTTYAIDSEVESADLNDLQDSLIQKHRMRRMGALWTPGTSYAGTTTAACTDPAWQRTITGAASAIVAKAPDSAYPSPYLELKCDEDNTNDLVALYSTDHLISTANTLLQAFLEFDAALVTAADIDLIDIIFGFFDQAGGAREISFFHADSGQGHNWHTRVRDAGSATEVDTLIATNTTFRKLRIEVYGSGVAGGARVKFYVDGALKATTTTNIPSGGMNAHFRLKNNAGGAAGTTEYYLGAALLDWVP